MKYIARCYIEKENKTIFATKDGDTTSLAGAGRFTKQEADKIAEERSGYKEWENREEEWIVDSEELAEVMFDGEEHV